MGKYFGTDGIRGVANEKLTPELAYKVARAVGYYLTKDLKEDESKVINIAKDTRVSGDMIEASLTAAFNSIGIDVNQLGIVPTPAVSFLSDKMNVIGGVMISASHNPIEDNGIKFFDKNGFKFTDKVENEIEKIILKNKDLPRPTHEKIGKVYNKENKANDYVEFIINSTSIDLNDIKVVLDCGNGAAYKVAPEILDKLGVDLEVINNDANGNKINVECGSTNPKLAAKIVKESNADIGIAHDGDADRVIFVDEKGNIVDGDTIMAICALDMLERNKLKNNTLVTTRYSNLALRELLSKKGGKIEIAQNGDRYVLEKMRENNYNLGGEKSGHIIFLDYNKTGDGILTAVQLLSILKRKNKSLSELSEVMNFWPQKLTNIKVKEKEKWKENESIANTIYEAEKEIGKKGRVFVRASGTEPVIRLMLEGKDKNLLKKWDKKLSEVIEKELN